MKKNDDARVPRKMKQALERELHSHVETHLQADHLEHIKVAHATASRLQQRRAQPRAHRVFASLKIYSADLTPLARAGLSELQPGGWVLLAETGPGLLAKVEIQEREKDFSVSRVTTGAVAADLDRAVRQARKRASRRRTQELRFLSVPAMHIMAVWSHFPKRPLSDTFTPISLNFAGLRQRRTYSRAATEKGLRRHATDLIVHWYERYQRETKQKTTEEAGKTGN
jgi:hypothetical protein